jgi:3-carboxy-cis,cis-muconate cycloisomerase
VLRERTDVDGAALLAAAAPDVGEAAAQVDAVLDQHDRAVERDR